MKIVNLQVENIKKIKAIDITPQGNMVTLSGKNEQGKTTILDSIWMAIGGGKTIPGQPIRKGQTKAKIVLDLGDMIATRKFTGSGSTLEVVNKEGLKYPSPQAVLDKLVNRFSFDVQEFAAADKKSQAETLLSIVEIPIDYAKLQAVSGVKVAPSQDPLADINAAYKMVYDDRTLVNRELTKAAATVEAMPHVADTVFVVMADLLAERDTRVIRNKKNEQERGKAAKLNVEACEYRARLDQGEENIAQLQKRLMEAQENWAKNKRAMDDTLKEKVKATQTAAKLVDEDIAGIDGAIRHADEVNKQAQAFERLMTATEAHAVKVVEAAGVDARLAAIKIYKDELMAQVKFPIAGLGFAKGGVTYDDLPFEQASFAQKMQVSCAIGMAQSPGLQVIRINDRNAFDSEHWAVIEQMAIDKDFQVWSELVDESGQVGIVIEDGTVKGAANNESN